RIVPGVWRHELFSLIRRFYEALVACRQRSIERSPGAMRIQAFRLVQAGVAQGLIRIGFAIPALEHLAKDIQGLGPTPRTRLGANTQHLADILEHADDRSSERTLGVDQATFVAFVQGDDPVSMAR